LFDFVDTAVSTGFVSAANAALARRARPSPTQWSLAVAPPDAFTPKWLG
jgi:hypothetical protein